MDTGPTYSIGDPNMPGALVCRSESRTRAGWQFADGTLLQDVTTRTPSNDFQQIRTGATDIPSVTRLSRSSMETLRNSNNRYGLWICRVQVNRIASPEEAQEVLNNFVFVGLYNRGRGTYMLHCQVT